MTSLETVVATLSGDILLFTSLQHVLMCGAACNMHSYLLSIYIMILFDGLT